MMDLYSWPSANLFNGFAPGGDGHPVLVLPGFNADDKSTTPIRVYLNNLNYRTHGWRLGRNLGPKTVGKDGAALARRIHDICNRYDQKVSLIGWSLGGIYAREFAKAMPDNVRQVITLACPFAGGSNSTRASQFYNRMVENEISTAEREERMRDVWKPPDGIPSTSIFSKTDGIANWRACVEHPAPMTDNIEVRASHSAMGYNPFVLFAIAERLSVETENWFPFDRLLHPWRQIAYPSSGHGYDI